MHFELNNILLVAIGISCAAFSAAVAVVAYMVWRRKKRAKEMKYVQISPAMPEKITETHYVQRPTKPNLNLKVIPFTVPGGMRSCEVSPSESQEFGTISDNGNGGLTVGDGSSSRRVSIDSTCGIDMKGAYSLGTIDPSLYTSVHEECGEYESPEDHIGRLWFAVEYERETEKLFVTVIQARKLPSRSFGNTNACDPFVRIHLMPDERRYLQTKPKKKICNPKFEERFVFQVSSKSLQERVLRLTVFDVDRHRKHLVIGHAIYPLKDHDYDTNEKVVIWRDLERAVVDSGSEKGELLLSLCYNGKHQRITVGVFEGKNFWKPDSKCDPAYYLKVSLLMQSKVLKSKRTDIIRKTSDPSFNESFTFKLNPTALDSASISIVAMQYSIGHRDKNVGRISLGSFMFARGKELTHWNEMVANQKQQISDWHKLT